MSQFSTSELPTHVKIVEVGPRDGLQNEKVREKLENILGFVLIILIVVFNFRCVF